MTGATPAMARVRRLPPSPESASQARAFVASLPGLTGDLLDTAQLLVSELVTNAVLHAHTEVQLRAWRNGPRLHVRVSDGDGSRRPVRRGGGLEASTGRGLALVELLAARFGVDPYEGGKTVWFELWDGVSGPAAGSSGWGHRDAAGPAAQPAVALVLEKLPVPLYRAMQLHQDSLLRECKLLSLGSGETFGISGPEMLEAEQANDELAGALADALESCAGPSSDVRLRLSLHPEHPFAVGVLRDVLDRANAVAAAGKLLTRGALPEIRRLRHWLLGQVGEAAAGRPTAPWTLGEWPQVAPVAPGPHGGTTQLASGSSVDATVTADESNVIRAVSTAEGDLLGWPASHLVGERVVALIPPAWRDGHVAGFTRFLLTGESRILGEWLDVDALHRGGWLVPVRLRIHIETSPDGSALFVAELRSRAD